MKTLFEILKGLSIFFVISLILSLFIAILRGLGGVFEILAGLIVVGLVILKLSR